MHSRLASGPPFSYQPGLSTVKSYSTSDTGISKSAASYLCMHPPVPTHASSKMQSGAIRKECDSPIAFRVR